MRIRDGGNNTEVIVNNEYPPYFGNQLKTNEYNSGVKRIKRLTFHSVVQVIIHSQFEDLIGKIKEVFPLFILKTNFGTRQGKGFGSFYLDRNDPCFPQNIKK
ncbi:MAG: hypothetical protein IPI30_19440 [Saprospiraceae bacterium]|nr:hypothetical protein [Candidatus Vicinibacter affinis]